jgi:hypothetical protein
VALQEEEEEAEAAREQEESAEDWAYSLSHTH